MRGSVTRNTDALSACRSGPNLAHGSDGERRETIFTRLTATSSPAGHINRIPAVCGVSISVTRKSDSREQHSATYATDCGAPAARRLPDLNDGSLHSRGACTLACCASLHAPYVLLTMRQRAGSSPKAAVRARFHGLHYAMTQRASITQWSIWRRPDGVNSRPASSMRVVTFRPAECSKRPVRTIWPAVAS